MTADERISRPDTAPAGVPAETVAAMARLEAENARLREQVKRLMAAENKLYTLQDHLSAQQRIYVRLAEVGRQLNSLLEVDEILETAAKFVVYGLGYERSAAFLRESGVAEPCFRVRAHEGYYEDDARVHIERAVLTGREPGLAGIDQDSGFICHCSETHDAATQALGELFLLDEYFAFALARKDGGLSGILVAGNTREQARYQTEIRSDGETLVAFSNLASQTATAIDQVRSYRALERERALLDEIVAARTRELSDALDTAHEAVRIKAEFLANVSHELRTPLNSIVNIPGALLEDYTELETYRCAACGSRFHSDGEDEAPSCPDCNAALVPERQLACVGEPAEHTRFLKLLQQQGRHLLALVNDILDFSRLEAGKLELVLTEVPVAELLSGVQATLESAHPERREAISYPRVTPGLTLVADRLRLDQILLNLIGNAVKFTPPGRAIRVGVEESPEPERGLLFSVADEGIGIPEDQLEAIFESFRQVDGSHTRTHGGAGLGLAITRQLVEMHGGRLSVESRLEHGSTFRVWLPKDQRIATRPAARAEPPAPEDLARKPLGFGRVVVIDDEPAQLSMARKLLEREGYTVELVSDGHQAVQTVEQKRPRFVLLDVMMPDINGFAVLTQLKRHEATRDTPIVVSTAFHYNEKRATELGALWLPKPWTARTLSAEHIERLLREVTPEDERAGELSAQQARVARLSQSVARILYVEDEDANFEVTQLSLRGKYELIRARCAREAFQHLARSTFDLVLLDIQLGGSEMNGVEVCEALRGKARAALPSYAREVRASCPIVFVTAYSGLFSREELLASGANDLVTKPVDFAQLLMIVSRLLVKGALSSIRDE